MSHLVGREGQRLGNYRLVRLLGRGSFAEVYLGEHVYLQSEAALKLMQGRLADEERAHFLAEARLLATLIHPHIVRVLDFGVEDNLPYLVMDYAPNGSLRQRHPRGSILPLATIVSYVQQMAEALHYAHEQKVIHRDIKPGNMLLGARQEVLLSDFGVALLVQSTRSQNIQGMAGTAAYMAPEQFQGKPRPASDQYALGVVVYEWLSGERPFNGSFLEIASQHLLTLPPSLQGKVPVLTPEIEQVVFTALAKDPRQRFASVRAFATALAHACQSVQEIHEAPIVIPPSQGASPQLLSTTIPSPSLAEPNATNVPVVSERSPVATPTVPAKVQPGEKPQGQFPRRVLIDYLLPASPSLGVNLLRNALLIISFCIVFSVCKRTFIYFHFPIRDPGTILPYNSLTGFGIVLPAAVLGRWRSLLAMLVYLAVGVAGLPVFSYSPHPIYGPTFVFADAVSGFAQLNIYLTWSYPVSAYVAGWLSERGLGRNFLTAVLAMLPGMLVLYIASIDAGVLQYKTLMYMLQSIWSYVPGDLITFTIAVVLLSMLWRLPVVKERIRAERKAE